MIEHLGYEALFIAELTVPDTDGPLDEEEIEVLTESIATVGLIHPVVVTEDHLLVCGRHRLEACRRLEWQKIDAFVIAYDEEEDLDLAKIDEDLCRRQLSVLEQCELILRRENVLDSMGARAKAGQGRPPHEGEPPSKLTTEDLAEEQGMAKRTYQRHLSIARKLCQQARNLLRDTELANNQSQLLELAGLEEAAQMQVTELLVAKEASSVQNAKRLLRQERQKDSAPPFEIRTDDYRIIQAEPVDAPQILASESVDLMLTYIPDATGTAPIWDVTDDPHYSERIVSQHREIAKIAGQVLRPDGSLIVMIGSTGNDKVLRTMRTHIAFVDSIPFIVNSDDADGDISPWRQVLWFTCGKPQTIRTRTPLMESSLLDSLGFDAIVEEFSTPSGIIFDPYGHSEIAGSAVYLRRTYVGFQEDEEAVRALAEKLDWDLELT